MWLFEKFTKPIWFGWAYRGWFGWLGGEKSMKDLLMLLDAIHLPLCRPEYQPRAAKNANGIMERITSCNAYVNEVCEIFGYKEFNGLLANQMIDLMASSPAWSLIGIDKAQFLANQGSLVIAGLKAEPHGHVAVCVPGKDKTSGRWGVVPGIANVGQDIFIGKGLSWGFSEMPQFWAWRNSL
jgi:hypothetical protein